MNMSKIPNILHFAVVVIKTIYHEGDERSRTNPGHGYPAYTEDFLEYIPFEDKEALDKWVVANAAGDKKTFLVVRADPQQIKLKSVVELESASKRFED